MSKLPLVAVRWHDSRGDAVEEVRKDNIQAWHKPHVVITFGLLLHEDEVGVTLVTEDTANDDYRGPTIILRPLIQEMWLVSANPYKRRKLKKEDE